MEEQPYVSCIKINGIPILPPIMNENVRKEMSRYKSLAVAVESRLKNLRVSKQIERIKHLQDSDESFAKETHCSDGDEVIESDTESVSFDSASNIESVLLGPIQTNKNDTVEPCIQETVPTDPKYIEPQLKSRVKTGKEQNLNAIRTTDSTMSGSESVTMSTDVNQYLNTSNNTEVKSSTTESTPEIWKPQVPKTLDIIPISLEDSNKENNESYCTLQTSKDSSDTPKLVRQGSYILDTPSPMLLAHMQTKLVNAEYIPNPEYRPTSTMNTNRRREWNILQAKTEWENQLRNKEIIVSESPQESNRSKCKRNHSFPSQRVCKSPCRQARNRPSLEMYRSTRSVDCIQSMLAKEYATKINSNICNQNEKEVSIGSTRKKSRINRNVSRVNLTNKLGGSLGSLNSGNVPICQHVQSKREEKLPEINRRTERILGTDNSEKSTTKLKPTITSEKLLAVFQEIEEVHKKQMNELMIRQQKEQNLLQQEFEKQQLLILSEIKKTFPSISLKLLSKDFPSTTPDDQVVQVNGKVIDDNFVQENESSPQSDLQIQSSPNASSTPPCPLNYFHTKDVLCNVRSQACKSSQSVQTQTDTSRTSDNFASKNLDPEIYGSRFKCSSVSRQLFPLDTKSTHVPVLDNSVYTEKHIQAATKINAYAKGYLVRRLMQTDRVIALKNTYKEALHCMLKLHIDAPLNLSELNFLHRLQLQCDAASMNIVELFAQSSANRMQIIAQDRDIKRSRSERPTSARSYSFATQRTLARKKLKEMGEYQQPPPHTRLRSSRSRCQTWTSDIREKHSSPTIIQQGIKRSTSAGTVRKPWR